MPSPYYTQCACICFFVNHLSFKLVFYLLHTHPSLHLWGSFNFQLTLPTLYLLTASPISFDKSLPVPYHPFKTKKTFKIPSNISNHQIKFHKNSIGIVFSWYFPRCFRWYLSKLALVQYRRISSSGTSAPAMPPARCTRNSQGVVRLSSWKKNGGTVDRSFSGFPLPLVSW